jgi:hypothetical protein
MCGINLKSAIHELFGIYHGKTKIKPYTIAGGKPTPTSI